MKAFATCFVLAALLLTVACSHRDNVSYKDDIKKALEQAELKDVTVSEDQDKEHDHARGDSPFRRNEGQGCRCS